MRTTEEGATLLGYARTILDLTDRARADLERLGNHPIAGTLEIGGTTTTGERLLPELLTAFTRRYPEVRLTLTVANTRDIVRRVTEGELALALVAGDVEHPLLRVEHIADEPQIVIATGDHLLANTSVDPRTLRGSTVLLREPGSSTRAYQEELLAQWRIPDARPSSIAGTGAIIAAVAHGLGIACVPAACARDALELGRVAPLHLVPEPKHRPLHIIRHRDKPLSNTEELFLRTITERTDP